MNYTFTHNQGNSLLEALNITIKKLGLQGVYTITELMTLIQHPKQETEEHYIYEIADHQVKMFQDVLDITVKEVGLQAASKVLELIEVFNNPTAPAEEAVEQAE